MVLVGRRFRLHLVIVSLWLSLRTCPLHGDDRDVYCLKSIQDSVQDPFGYLTTTWRFDNRTQGAICSFTGVECWHPDENKVLKIKLANMGLKGSFPLGLSYCSSMTGLDLSSNNFSGPLPSNISRILGFLTSLVLSSNNFSGQIPADLAESKYLNELSLDHNHFSGQIPANFSSLSRLKKFSVANNLLSGQIPRLQTNFTKDAFANNPELCGTPLPGCQSGSKSLNTDIITGTALGGVTVSAVLIGAALVFVYRRLELR